MRVLRIAAIVIGAAVLIATGVGAIGGLGLAAGVTSLAGLTGLTGIGLTILTGALVGAAVLDLSLIAAAIRPSQGGSQTKWKADPYAGLPYPMGRTLVAGNIAYRRGSGGDNAYENFVTILSICTIAALTTTFMNKTTVTFDADGANNGGANGTYSGQIWQSWQRGLCPEPIALQPRAGAMPGWTAQHKLSGMAATLLTFKYDSKATNGLTSEPSPGWIVEGVMVYDPRLDDTYPGGIGPCRAFDETTYVYSENPHLHGLTWAMGRFQNGVRVAGIGNGPFAARAKITGIDVGSFVEGANLDDARGWKLGGQVTTRPDTPWNSLKSMLQAGGATPVLIGGRISCVNRAPRVSLATITRSDIVGECSLTTTQPRRTRINGVIPQYRSEAHDWEMVSASEVSVAAYVTLDGDERTKEIPYPLVQDVNQVSQLARYDVEDAREAGPGTVPLKPFWLNYKIGDCLNFEPEDGLSMKVQLTGRAVEAQTGVVTYTIRGETDAKHAFALGQSGVAPPIVSLIYDPNVSAPLPADWSLAGATLTMNGNSIPAIVLTGAASNPNVDTIITEIRQIDALQNETGSVLLDETGAPLLNQDSNPAWLADTTIQPGATNRTISNGVISGAAYQVAVSYRIRGVLSDRLVLGPVVAGQLAIAGLATSQQLIAATAMLEQQSDLIAQQNTKLGQIDARLTNANIA